MKKITVVVITFFLGGQLFAQAGRIRITFVGFKCIRETWDDILGLDGRGDEVFFRFNISRSDPRGNVRQNFERLTDVYGDKSGAFTNRIKAGTESSTGGVRAGDYVNTNILLGEYDLDNGDITTIIPTAWEQDPIADNSNAFAATVGGYIASLNQRIAPIMIGVHLLGGDIAGALFYGGTLGITATRPAGDQGELGRPGTRPIGMLKNGDFTPKVFSLNTPNLVTLVNSNYGHGNGVFEVNYNEEALGNARDHGNYTILLKIEFAPKAIPVATSNGAPPPAPGSTTVPPPSTSTPNTGASVPPPPAASTGTTRSIPTLNRTLPAQNAPIRQTVNPAVRTNAAVRTYTLPSDWAAVTWTGTRDGQPFGLRFNPPTAWVLKDVAHGTVDGAGTCKAVNNILTISYFANNAQYTLTSTYYDAGTGELSGSWEKAGDPSQHGSWIVVRKK